MKKNFIAILLVLLCFPWVVFGISGCGNQSPSVTAVVFVAGNEERIEYDLGTFYQNDEILLPNPEIYAKYSDGSRTPIYADDPELQAKYFYHDGTSDCETENFLNEGFRFSAGTYSVVYTYKDFTIRAKLVVKEALAYTSQVSASACRYREPLPTVRIQNSLGQEETDFNIYYIPREAYDSLDVTSAAFKESLSAASKEYDSVYGDIVPGEYYVYGKNHKDEISSVSRIKVNLGILTLAEKGEVTGNFSYNFAENDEYVLGKIDLSQVPLTMDSEKPIRLIDQKGNEWYDFSLEWKYGNSKVDRTNNNTTSVVKIVTGTVEYEGEQVKLFEDLDWGPAKMFIEKGQVSIFREYSTLNEVEYSGEAHSIYLLFGEAYGNEKVKNLVKITKNDEVITPTIDDQKLVLDSQTEIGEYRYVLELLDPTNYCWIDDSYQEAGRGNLTYTFTVLPIESSLQRIENILSYTQEGNTYRIKVLSGIDEIDQVYITPYKTGTLTVQMLDEYVDGEVTYTTNIQGTVRIRTIQNEDYFEITVTEYASGVDGCLIVNFKATGADHYADIDKTVIIPCINPSSP